jgi:glucose-1-phosphate cytidylyltransferase
MKTILLAGGFGTRIRDVVADVPKPMITIGRYPILWHIMKYYAAFGHAEFVVCLGYQGQVIKQFFLDYRTHTSDLTIRLAREPHIVFHGGSADDWEVTLADTGVNAMTGARVWRARHYIDGDDFMLTYGDGVGNVPLPELLAFHRKHGKAMTVTGVRPPGRFGELEVDERGQALGFNEKPQVSAGRISGGFFVCRRSVLDYLDERENLVFEEEPMQRLVQDGQLMVFPHDGFWHPMDTYRDYRLLNDLWDGGKAPWKVW